MTRSTVAIYTNKDPYFARRQSRLQEIGQIVVHVCILREAFVEIVHRSTKSHSLWPNGRDDRLDKFRLKSPVRQVAEWTTTPTRNYGSFEELISHGGAVERTTYSKIQLQHTLVRGQNAAMVVF